VQKHTRLQLNLVAKKLISGTRPTSGRVVPIANPARALGLSLTFGESQYGAPPRSDWRIIEARRRLLRAAMGAPTSSQRPTEQALGSCFWLPGPPDAPKVRESPRAVARFAWSLR
jgi:hypothetical protein